MITRRMTTYEIESLVLNSDEGESFGGLRQSEVNYFQSCAFSSGRWVKVAVDNPKLRTYRVTFAL